MTEVDFVKLSPTQNMTVLVTSRHAVADYPSIATELLSAGHVHAEQVGFVRPPTSTAAQVRLHMAGDEFCGNATMALAALTSMEQDLDVGRRTGVVLEVSGLGSLVTCEVERLEDHFACELTAPRPISVETYDFAGVETGVMVRYPDAAHLVVECARHDRTSRDRAEEVARRLGETEGVSMVGVMLYDPERGELAPLINVPALDSMVWERSCGSGTASIGAYLAARAGAPVRASVHQPGGTMHVRANHGPLGVTELLIGGQVRIVAEGRAYVHA